MSLHGDHEHGAAWRRRQRRQRRVRMQWQMLLATYEHHAAPRRQMKARSRGEESEMNNAFTQKTPPPGAASTMYCRMDDEEDVLAGHSQGYSGTPWSRLSRPSCLFRFSVLRCRRWGLSWWNSYRSLTLRPQSRLSKCPSSLKIEFPQRFAVSSSAEGRTVGGSADGVVFFFSPAAVCRADHWTFQLLVVVVVREVFKVYAQNRVQQQRRLGLSAPVLLLVRSPS